MSEKVDFSDLYKISSIIEKMSIVIEDMQKRIDALEATNASHAKTPFEIYVNGVQRSFLSTEISYEDIAMLVSPGNAKLKICCVNSRKGNSGFLTPGMKIPAERGMGFRAYVPEEEDV